MRRRSQRGFTLLELMVVVAIVAVFSALMVGQVSRPDAANAQNVSQQLVSTFMYTRTRALATRKVHRITVYNTGSEQALAIESATNTGMAFDATTVWRVVELRRIPYGAKVRAVVGNTLAATSANPTQDTGLPYLMYFKPDGSATASTVYLTDFNGTPHFYRVLVYKATGSSYARETW